MTTEELKALSEMHRRSFVGDYGFVNCKFCGEQLMEKSDIIDINPDFKLVLLEGIYYTRHRAGFIKMLETELSKEEIISTLNKTVSSDMSAIFIPDLGMPIIRRAVGFIGKIDIERLFQWDGNRFTILWDSNKALNQKK